LRRSNGKKGLGKKRGNTQKGEINKETVWRGREMPSRPRQSKPAANALKPFRSE